MNSPWPPDNIAPHARTTFDEVQQAGPPGNPIPFDPPTVGRALRDAAVLVIEPLPPQEASVQTVFLVSEGNGGIGGERAYLFLRSLGEGLARNGAMKLCLMLNRDRRESVRDEIAFRKPVGGAAESWVVLKEIDKSRPGAEEAGRREAAAMQFVRNDRNEHVLSSIEALEDERYLYIVMPFCEGGDIFSSIWYPQLPEHSLPAGPAREKVVRYYFRQMLECLHYLQSKGICHGDLSPENIMIRGGRCIFIDLDTCLRVPRLEGDVNRRLLVTPRLLSAKYPYMAPEIFLPRLRTDVSLRQRCARKGYRIPHPPPFDGFGTDQWCLGTTLYVMLTTDFEKLYGIPFEVLDLRYRDLIHYGLLADVLKSQESTGLPLSSNAIDLLAKMLRPNPAERLTLEQVMMHPWVCGEVTVPGENV